MFARVAGVAAYLPPQERPRCQVEELIRENSPGVSVPSGIIESLTGIRTRRVAPEGMQCSDLAAEAVRRVLDKTRTSPDDVDVLIFA